MQTIVLEKIYLIFCSAAKSRLQSLQFPNKLKTTVTVLTSVAASLSEKIQNFYKLLTKRESEKGTKPTRFDVKLD